MLMIFIDEIAKMIAEMTVEVMFIENSSKY
jgi:hypothetical protein